MSLTSALLTAQSALNTTAKQTALVTRNIAGANDPDFTRRIGSVVSGSNGSTYLSMTRSADAALLSKFIESRSQYSASSTLQKGLDRLSGIYSADDASGSPSSLLGNLRDSLQLYASQPGNTSVGEAAVSKATELANALNRGTEETQKLRLDADSDISSSVKNLNSLLAQFETVNDRIINGTRSGADVADYLDQRDGLLKQMSSEIGITTLVRGDNDMVVFAESGVTLFEGSPRTVSFTPSSAFSAGTEGNDVYIDGVPLSHGTFQQPYGTGRLSGLLQLRNDTAPGYQSQLDEIARSLVSMFAEIDQKTPATLPAVPGLFTYSGAPLMPPDASILPGIAGTIKVASAFILTEGGDPARLRDGGAGGSDYSQNPERSAGFSARLQNLIGAISAPRSYDPNAYAGDGQSLLAFSAATISSLEAKRKTATQTNQYNSVLASRAEEAVSNAGGVNLDEEMESMLALEHSYKASARIISAVDAMLNELLQAVR
ncbi:flagellar hook-associated protein FlgK [Phyllobacterium endophyticum]|uniref:flagellar hook-associated protein FlgK n=1 Tax=Phyllobacterium endophyticum TaxID=1149773 RepID=UPI0011CBE592|nr:flagellar hook-associated protein FlgK [Phyllobacterium endophyticum]TXR47193.1 flagellar hook-associated protein FlgK [Phyllobacterium endophyticum]